MGCCGQGRAALVYGEASGKRDAAVAGPAVPIEFMQAASAFIRGPATGRHYQFHAGARVQPVDPRDAAILVRSGYFRAAQRT